MPSVKPTPNFDTWFATVEDVTVRAAVIARIRRLEFGLMDDVGFVGDGVSELRIHIGSGWRVYFTYRGNEIILLLGGGTRRTQKRDIKRAKEIAALIG